MNNEDALITQATTAFILRQEDGTFKTTDFNVKAKEFEHIEPKLFLTKDEMVQDIIENRLSDEDKEALAKMPESELITLHFSFGMWIRNSYGLWLENNPNTESNPEPDSPRHPDNFSFTIITAVAKQLSGKDDRYDDAMKILE